MYTFVSHLIRETLILVLCIYYKTSASERFDNTANLYCFEAISS